MPSDLATVTDAYARQVDNLAAETRRRLLSIWDALAPWGDAELDRFHDIARPLVEAAAQAGVDLTTVYVDNISGAAGTASPLIPADAAARLYDPSDRIGKLIANGMEHTDAVRAARTVVDNLGHDTAYRAARQSMAEVAPPHTKWRRRVTGKSCQWCLSLAGAEFYSAADATFGHDRCDCLACPSEAVATSNQQIIDAAGGDKAVKKYKQANQLKRSERTARKRQEQAKADQLTEPDPDRRERLSIREQEWETRAERAAERLALLTSP